MQRHPSPAKSLAKTALAFRGYNTQNLGRTAELLQTRQYRSIVSKRLRQASVACAETLGRPVDLEERVCHGREASLADYAESVAMVFAAELAQVDLLREVHGVEVQETRLAFGYSLGELVALVASGRLIADETLRVPLAMAADCASLAEDVTMGVLFSRGGALEERLVHQACEQITAEGEGAIAVSAVLSPNTCLLLGQGKTVLRLRGNLKAFFAKTVHLRLNDSRWPPLHTPIVRQRHVPDRAAVMMQTMTVLDTASPPVCSLVTGEMIDGQTPLRENLRNWVDQPQRLWDAVCATLAADVETVIHVGPSPNVIPATFRRLADNIQLQTGKRNLAAWGSLAARQAQRTWLAALLPKSTALLRAPKIQHVILEDWLLDNA